MGTEGLTREPIAKLENANLKYPHLIKTAAPAGFEILSLGTTWAGSIMCCVDGTHSNVTESSAAIFHPNKPPPASRKPQPTALIPCGRHPGGAGQWCLHSPASHGTKGRADALWGRRPQSQRTRPPRPVGCRHEDASVRRGDRCAGQGCGDEGGGRKEAGRESLLSCEEVGGERRGGGPRVGGWGPGRRPDGEHARQRTRDPERLLGGGGREQGGRRPQARTCRKGMKSSCTR